MRFIFIIFLTGCATKGPEVPKFKVSYNTIIHYEEQRDLEIDADSHEDAENQFDKMELDDDEQDREFLECIQIEENYEDPNQIKMDFCDEQ